MPISRNDVEKTCAFVRRWADWIARHDPLPLIHAAYQRIGSANAPRPLLGLVFQDGAGMRHWQIGRASHPFPDLHAAILCCQHGSASDPVTSDGGLWVSSFELPDEPDARALMRDHRFLALPIVHPPAMRQMFLDVCHWHQEPSSFSRDMHLKAAWLKLLACFHDQIRHPDRPDPHRAPPAVQRVLAWIHHHYHDASLRQEDLARVAHQDPNHLGRVFKQAMGVPPMRYVRQVRIRQAADLLESTDYPIGHIAREVGFADAQHFAKLFRQAMGTTPGDHRRHRLRAATHEKTTACR